MLFFNIDVYIINKIIRIYRIGKYVVEHKVLRLNSDFVGSSFME